MLSRGVKDSKAIYLKLNFFMNLCQHFLKKFSLLLFNFKSSTILNHQVIIHYKLQVFQYDACNAYMISPGSRTLCQPIFLKNPNP